MRDCTSHPRLPYMVPAGWKNSTPRRDHPRHCLTGSFLQSAIRHKPWIWRHLYLGWFRGQNISATHFAESTHNSIRIIEPKCTSSKDRHPIYAWVNDKISHWTNWKYTISDSTTTDLGNSCHPRTTTDSHCKNANVKCLEIEYCGRVVGISRGDPKFPCWSFLFTSNDGFNGSWSQGRILWT